MDKTYTLDDVKHYKDYHAELWTWISENPRRNKNNWFDEYWKDVEVPLNLCFACEYTLKHNTVWCPLMDNYCGGESGDTDCLNGLFSGYLLGKRQKNIDKVVSYAKRIAELPWIEEKENNND